MFRIPWNLTKNIKATLKRDSSLIEIIDILAPEKGYDKKRFIELSLYNIAFDNYFEVNSGTYDESVAAGSIKYISNDSLRQYIFDYYRIAKQNINDRGNFNQSFNRRLSVFFEKFMTSSDLMNIFGSKSRLPELDLNALGKDVEFMGLVTEKLSTHNQQRGSWSRYIKDAKQLHMLIEKELEQ